MLSATTNRLAAISRFALGITINGSLAPSSKTTFWILFAAPMPTSIPACSLPVSAAAIRRESPRILSTSREPNSRVWKTPSGKPARRNSSSISSALCGTIEACFSSPTFPAISAGAANRSTCQNGKFHDITASTGPSGC
jgi:hypothetical protein